MTKKKALIATGGTGGHIFPACSLANYLITKDFSIILTTDKRGLNYVKEFKNLKFIKIPSSSLVKTNLFVFLFSASKIIFSIIKSLFILLFTRPAIVFGMGGYSSFPICIAAALLRVKFIIYENNLIIGKANKYLLPFAEKIFVSYKEVDGISQKYSNKIVETGNIIREEIINSNIINKKESNELKKLKILVLGGSQGAKVFANELPQIFEKLKIKGTLIEIYQQCQKNQNDQLSLFYKTNNIDFELFNFTDRIIDYYSKANLIITRSGASVLGELINMKKPFISIPLPTSADNHQFKNAQFYEKKGYGYLLEEKDIKNKLYDLIFLILKDKLLINNILDNQRKYSDKDIFKNLLNLIEKAINEKN